MCHIYHRLQGNHVRMSQCTRFESLTLKMKIKYIENLTNIGRRTYLVNVNMCAQIGIYRSNRLFAVHNRKFSEESTNEQLPTRITLFKPNDTDTSLHNNTHSHVFTILQDYLSKCFCKYTLKRKCNFKFIQRPN